MSLVVTVVGCFNPTAPPGAPCANSQACPAPLQCIAEVCTTPTGSPDAPPDALFGGDAIEGFDASPDAWTSLQVVVDEPSKTRDTFTYDADPGATFGNSTTMAIDAEGVETALVWFDLTAVPTNARVVSARFTVGVADEADEAGGTVRLFPMLEAWAELEATFLARKTGLAWSTSGARPPARATTSIGEFAPAMLGATYTIELTPEIVEGWIAAPATNFGFALVRGTSTQHVHLNTKESSSAPKLTLDLLVP